MSRSAPGGPQRDRQGGDAATAGDGRTDSLAGARRRSGRRAGGPPTRAAILEAARNLFAAAGYQRTTIRKVAAAAGVDPALVHHYFGTKEDLLRAALTPPVDVSALLASVLAGSEGTPGERAARAFLSIWEDPRLRPSYQAIVRCAASHDEATAILRRVLAEHVLGPATVALGTPEAPLRATLVASQLIGLAMVRYITSLEPLASAGVEDVVAAVAPSIDRYLSEPLQLPHRNGITDDDGR